MGGSAGRKLGLNRNRGGWNSDRRAKNLGGLTVMDDNDGPNPYISRGSGPKPCVGVCQYLKMMNAKQQSKRSFYNGINSLEDYDHFNYDACYRLIFSSMKKKFDIQKLKVLYLSKYT